MPTTASPSGLFARPKPSPVLAHPHDPFDSLPAFAHALTAALACPDRFFIACQPGAQRDRCINALLDELRERGERVLLLTADAERANHWAELLLSRDVAVVRALGTGEAAASLPPSLVAVCSHTLGIGRVEEIRSRQTEVIREVSKTLQQHAATAEVWPKLQAIVERSQPTEADAIRAADIAKAQAALPRLRAELASLQPQLTAKKSGSVFTRDFWRATFNTDLARRVSDLEEQIRLAEQTVGTSDHTPLPAKLSTETSDLAEFATLCETLTQAEQTPPAAATLESVTLAAQHAEGSRQEAESALNFTRKTLTDLETDPTALAVQFLNRATLIVGPRTATTDLAVTCARVDRILVESAESVTQTDWEAMASTTDRTILLGDFDHPVRPAHANGKPSTNGVHSSSTSAHEFWRMAHRPLWLRTDDHLIARLNTVLSDTHREPLADRPEIELLFGLSPEGEFVLAEVQFPNSLGVAAAKAFVATELGEVQLVPLGPARWHADQLLVCWPLLESQSESAWIDVDVGVREQVVPLDGLPATAAVSFDPTHWTREAAEEWVNEKTRAARTRRTAVLPEPVLA